MPLDLVPWSETDMEREGEGEREGQGEGGSERQRKHEDNGSWRRVPSSGENGKRMGRLKTLNMNFSYFTILLRTECCFPLKNPISYLDLPADNLEWTKRNGCDYA